MNKSKYRLSAYFILGVLAALLLWLITYELWKKYGVWLADEIKH